MRRTWIGILIASLMLVPLAACTGQAPAWTVASGASASPAPATTTAAAPGAVPLGISNGLTVAVTLVVNGSVVDTVPAGAQQSPVGAALPPLPWAVEAKSPSGRVLLTLEVPEGTYVSSTSGKGARADLACGRLDLYVGPPMLGPVFLPDPSQSCD